MEEMYKDIETELLEAAVESKKTVQVIFTNGYQTPAVIVDFDCNAFKLEVEGKTQLSYRHAVSTIVMD